MLLFFSPTGCWAIPSYSAYMGYWPSVRSRWLDIGQVLFCVLWTETDSRSINSHKKWTRPVSSRLYRTSLVSKGFIIWLSGKFFSRDTAGSPERAKYLNLARSSSQSQRAIEFILPACGANRIMTIVMLCHFTYRYPIWHHSSPVINTLCCVDSDR